MFLVPFYSSPECDGAFARCQEADHWELQSHHRFWCEMENPGMARSNRHIPQDS